MKTCFYCEKELTTINEGFLGDCLCLNCNVINSFYPDKPIEIEEPEKEAKEGDKNLSF